MLETYLYHWFLASVSPLMIPFVICDNGQDSNAIRESFHAKSYRNTNRLDYLYKFAMILKMNTDEQNTWYTKFNRIKEILYLNDDANQLHRSPTPEMLWDELKLAEKYLSFAEIMFLVLNPEGEVLSTNNSAARTVGYKIDDLVGMNWIDKFVLEGDRNEIRHLMQQICQGMPLIAKLIPTQY